MKVSLNWIRDINRIYKTAAEPAPDGVDDLVAKIGAQLGAVEEVIDLGKKYEGAIVVKVVSQQKHPNADKLNICMIDGGKGRPVQVVHGASNVKEGMLAAWIPPGATVPSTYNEEPLVIEKREIRGVTSNGMLASPRELDLGESHEGILEVDENVKAGTSFSKAYELDDYIIDIENKMFTHRPDCFGTLGLAREIAGIQHKPFKSPDWYRQNPSILNDGRKNVLPLKVKNEIPKLAPRFCVVALKDIKVAPSPIKLQTYLLRVGVRPINNIVDLTNYMMMLSGQPVHAYDYDKLSGVLGVRLSKKGEKLLLIGGKEITLDGGAVVITDGRKPIGLGGVMGGADTEVSENTRNIIFEVATFDMTVTRKTARDYGLFTEAAIRFTKNQSPLQNLAVIAQTVAKTQRNVGGRVASQIVDDNHVKDVGVAVSLSADFINSRLGLQLSTKEMQRLLQNVEFEVKLVGNKLDVIVPFWRTDIQIPEDVVEEIGRLYGYDKLPTVLPKRFLAPAPIDPMLAFKSKVRDILVGVGVNEALTYSFVNESLLQVADQDPQKTYHIRNALSPDLQYYRPSLVPSLLEKIHPDIKAGYDQFAIFEIGKVHIRGQLDSEQLPREFENLALVITSKQNKQGAAYFAAKQYLDFLLNKLGVQDAKYSQIKPRAAAYEPSRSAWVSAANALVGVVGEPSAKLRTGLKLPPYTAQFELNLTALMPAANPIGYRPLNRFPSTTQDITLRNDHTVNYAQLTDFLRKRLKKAAKEHGYTCELSPLDIYRRPSDNSHKQTTWRIELMHPQRTLTTAEVNKLMEDLAAAAKKELKAERL